MMLPVIGMPFFGQRLSWLDLLCIQSFRNHGYSVQVHSFRPLECEIEGVKRYDAADTLGEGNWNNIVEQEPNLAIDLWRIKFVATTGYVAVEPDIFCLNRLQSSSGFILGYEKTDLVSSAVFGLPSHSLTLARLIDSFEWVVENPELSTAEQRAAVDQSALTYHLKSTGEVELVQPIEAFYSVSLKDRMWFADPSAREEQSLPQGASAVRLWSRRLAKQISGYDGYKPRPGSFLDLMASKHNIVSSDSLNVQAEAKEGRRHVTYLLEALKPQRSTCIVDVGANPLTPPPYAELFAEDGCEIVGFEPHPEAFAKLESQAGPKETYLPYAVGDGGTHELHIANESGLTSVLPAYEGAFRFLGRSRRNMKTIDRQKLATVRLDDLTDLVPFELLKIDIQGGEVMVFEGAANMLAHAIVVITEVRYYQLYEGEPMFGGVDTALRKLGFQLHKIVEEKAKVIPNSQIERLKRAESRNQVIDADAVYLRDPGTPEALSNEQLKHMAILAAGVFDSIDLSLYCLDLLVGRGVVQDDLPAKFASRLPVEFLR